MTRVILRGTPNSAGGATPDRVGVDVALIGFQDQGNLGMGYLAAALEHHHYTVRLIEFRDDADSIVERIKRWKPAVVGFSLIFQYYLDDYRRLIDTLRANGVTAHITMGGHYPSLCPDEVLAAVPALDSIAMFEGEYTLVDLTSALTTGQDWQAVAGLAYRAGGNVAHSEPRALAEDLDALAWPLRPYEPERVLGWGAMPVLASRGCARRCSFCSIHTFYRGAPGRTVRVRKAKCVADELESLTNERNVRIYLFQDDDFPLWGRSGKRWVAELADEIEQRGLAERCIWKISCRAEYIEHDLFARLRDAGLYLVYMGLESGTAEGLEVLNKKISVDTNRRAVDILKGLGILVEYGFMLFDPSSSFASVRANIEFLRDMLADGSGGAVFCRMLPYGGTPIRDQLRAEGRLRGDVRSPDYAFLDPRLNEYHRLLDRAVSPWIHGEGLSHQLNWAWHEVTIIDRLIGELPGRERYRTELATLTCTSNNALFDFVDRTSTAFEAGDLSPLADEAFVTARRDLGIELLRLRNSFMAEHQRVLVSSVAASEALSGPILAPQIF